MSTVQSITPAQEKWDRIPDNEIVTRTVEALRSRGIGAQVVDTPKDALGLVSSMIPEGAEIMTGASVSLDQIGFTELLKSGTHRWKDLKQEIMSESDRAKQRTLRVRATGADYFIGSVQAVAETGEVVVASATGSQLPAYAFNAKNVVWVSGVQKIVPTLQDALRRVREHALPLESARMKTQGFPGSMIGKMLIIEAEPSMLGRNLTMIFVKGKLGF